MVERQGKNLIQSLKVLSVLWTGYANALPW